MRDTSSPGSGSNDGRSRRLLDFIDHGGKVHVPGNATDGLGSMAFTPRDARYCERFVGGWK